MNHVHSVAVAEFDVLKGGVLSYVYPPNPSPRIVSHSREEIAGMCLPDGGHNSRDDIMYLLLTGESKRQLYGIAFFLNKHDTRQRRGATQIALVAISEKPDFSIFRPFISNAANAYLTSDRDKRIIMELYHVLGIAVEYSDLNGNLQEVVDSFSKKSTGDFPGLSEDDLALSVESNKKAIDALIAKNKEIETTCLDIWNVTFILQSHSRDDMPFKDASVRNLVSSFKHDTMLIWLAIMSSKRILFFGPGLRARAVCNHVISAPQLVGTLADRVIPHLVPYVTLAHIESVISRDTFICGATNGLLGSKDSWFDVFVDCVNMTVTWKPSPEDKGLAKVTGNDYNFISSVYQGVLDGQDEKWCRENFLKFTFQFLEKAVNSFRNSSDRRLSSGSQSSFKSTGSPDLSRLRKALPRMKWSTKSGSDYLVRMYVQNPESYFFKTDSKEEVSPTQISSKSFEEKAIDSLNTISDCFNMNDSISASKNGISSSTRRESFGIKKVLPFRRSSGISVRSGRSSTGSKELEAWQNSESSLTGRNFNAGLVSSLKGQVSTPTISVSDASTNASSLDDRICFANDNSSGFNAHASAEKDDASTLTDDLSAVVGASVTAPVSAPVAAPLAAPVAAPVTASVAAPVTANVTAPAIPKRPEGFYKNLARPYVLPNGECRP